MEQEATATGNKKKFLIIALVAVLVVAGALGYLFMQKDTPGPVGPSPVTVANTVVTMPHIYTDAEKRQSLEDFAKNSSTSSTISEAEKLRALKSFSAKTQTPVLSDEEKRKALEAFVLSTQSVQ